MDFLSEALAHSGRTVMPPFAECVVLHSLFSRLAPTLGSRRTGTWRKRFSNLLEPACVARLGCGEEKAATRSEFTWRNLTR